MTRRILFAVTDAITAVSFLRGQVSFLRSEGLEVHIATGITDALRDMAAAEGVHLHDVPLTRGWGRWSDLSSLRRAVRVLRAVEPDILSYSTPKASLVWALASLVARPASRVYQARGLRLEGVSTRHPGFYLLYLMEFLACRLAQVTLCVSPSLRDAMVRRRLVSRRRSTVLAAGSSNGVDTVRFAPMTPATRRDVRAELGLGPDSIALVYVGRLARDKGLTHLADAMELVPFDLDLRLVVVGWPEPDLDLEGELASRPKAAARTSILAPSDDVPRVMAAADVFVLPSLREGLSNVLLEAQSMGVPCITTTATGCGDAVSAGHSALVIPPADPRTLANAIETLARDPGRRDVMGRAGREFVEEHFRAEDVWARHAAFYSSLLPVGTQESENRSV